MTTQSTKEIMNLESQVCSLDLAKRLKELGMTQNTVFVWFNKSHIKGDFFWQLGFVDELTSNKIELKDFECYPAFTVAELGLLLPDKLDVKARATDFECDYSLSINKLESGKWELCYCGQSDAGCYGNTIIVEDTEANARAKMFVYLLETKQRIK